MDIVVASLVKWGAAGPSGARTPLFGVQRAQTAWQTLALLPTSHETRNTYNLQDSRPCYNQIWATFSRIRATMVGSAPQLRATAASSSAAACTAARLARETESLALLQSRRSTTHLEHLVDARRPPLPSAKQYILPLAMQDSQGLS